MQCILCMWDKIICIICSPVKSLFPNRLPYFLSEWHLLEPVRLDRVAKRSRAAADLHKILFASTAALTGIPICMCPIHSPHSTLKLPEGRARRESVFSHHQGHCSPTDRDSPWPQHWIAHHSCCVLFIFRFCLQLYFATPMQRKMNMPSTRTRWRCSMRRCPQHPTLSCFTPHGKWTVSYQVFSDDAE